MKNWVGKILLTILGLIFLLRGGFAMLMGLWRVILPLVLVGGGIYFLKKALAKQKTLGSKQKSAPNKVGADTSESEVIHICPHCLQPYGSCPRCVRLKT